jgi:pyruvate dehydrogenase E2 component (dihydrolipoamide acetyltransferase)
VSDITMPKLSDSMEEGTILSWLKADGEQVEAGEDLVEIETDKATVTHQAEVSGTLTITAEVGTSHAVGATIGRLGAADRADAPPARPVEQPTAAVAVAANGRGNGVVSTSATPLARRIAEHHGIDLEGVAGSGPLGRITRADVLRTAGIAPDVPPTPQAAPAPEAARATAARAPAEPTTSPLGTTRVEPSRLQQVVARRMAEAKATVPHFQVQAEVTMDAAIALRAKLKSLAGEGEAVPSFNDIIVKAAATALREHPLANGSYKDDAFELHDAVNVGVAVAADDALVVPTVFDAAAKSLGEIARETRRLASRVRGGDITPPELSGGTFTVSNLGMFGMTAITPVINPPQAAILGVGAMRDVLARVDGEIVERHLLTLTLSCDHRILYGADAARFLSRIRELLEEPLRLAL